jgi:hypothetical protein
MTDKQVHGPGGIFSSGGSDAPVVSTIVQPTGILEKLPVQVTSVAYPIFYYLTGVEENSGSEPSGPCDTCISGFSKGCAQTAPFGLICRESRQLTVGDLAVRLTAADVNLSLLNRLAQPPTGGSFDLNDLVRYSLAEVGVLIYRKLAQLVWQGNPANNVDDGYREPLGLDALIGTGRVDAFSGASCSSLDSWVIDFSYASLYSTDPVGGFQIVHALESLENAVYTTAVTTGLWPAEFVWCMRPEMWAELTRVWPAAWLATRGITLPSGNVLQIDAARVREMSAEMQRDMVLEVNGRRWPVVIDHGIFEFNHENDSGNLGDGEFASNIYLVPMRALGRDVTFLQYKDYNADMSMLRNVEGAPYWVVEGGRYLITTRQQAWCQTIMVKTEPRIVMQTPQIAGRIDHVKYVPKLHTRQPFQTDLYFVDGGLSVRPTPSWYW